MKFTIETALKIDNTKLFDRKSTLVF